ncbi:MAG TPA: hypothetical protein RMH99_02820 [Sandaracinaceae bacterium LLY-WYZ-13_1]|nr:hypothetical protein [Sandaracinaceae bacterium LLY-WYZ-13_1]
MICSGPCAPAGAATSCRPTGRRASSTTTCSCACPRGAPGPFLVASTNCNGGIEELLSFAEPPDRDALWHWRCPDGEFEPRPLPALLASARTPHCFDPCELLAPDARSELKPEHRRRQRGGGWEPTF